MTEHYTEQDKRRILLELRYIYREAELCQKWNVTKYRLRQWKKEANYTYLAPTLRELVIMALHNGKGSIAGMISYLDYLDHAVYSEPELLAVLRGLQVEGIALEAGGDWRYNPDHSRNDTSFIF